MADALTGPIVEARDLVKTYRAGTIRVHALRGVSLDVARGEMVAIMGHSGCGKTTLLNCLAGLDIVDSGEISIAGESLRAMSDRRRTAYRARAMGFIFQQFNLLPVLSALENVELPLLVAGTHPRTARARAREVLAAVDMEGWWRHRPAQLSGGQQQRVSIARALVNDPRIIWADEPTGNLDSATAASVMDLIGQLNRANGQTFVVVTHDAAVGARAHRIVHMNDGRIVDQQPAASALPQWAVGASADEGFRPNGHDEAARSRPAGRHGDR
jgi:putative ABC transport system ATP-binding protein